MTIDVSSLRNALTALEKSLKFLASDMAKEPDLREQFRAAAIQAFKFTHELAYKMLKRQLEQMSADPAAIDTKREDHEKMPLLRRRDPERSHKVQTLR